MALKTAALPLLFLALIGNSHTVEIKPVSSTPVLLWGTQDFFGKTRTSVNYETLTLADVWSGLTDSWLGGSQQANDIVTSSKAPEIFVVFAGTQVTPRDFAALAYTPDLKPLEDALRTSPSSLLLPNINSEGERADFARLAGGNDAANVEVVGSCAADDNPGNIQDVLDKAVSDVEASPEGKPQVIVICSLESLKDEMMNLGTVTKTLKEWGGSYAMMYVSHDTAGKPQLEDLTGQKRRLLAEEIKIDYTVCDELCMTQVKLLEAFILALVLVFALASGLCCTHILDGPSQFEKASDELS